MAEGGDVEWELSKENIQPLRRGRAISALHQALSQQQDGLSSAVNHQRQYGQFIPNTSPPIGCKAILVIMVVSGCFFFLQGLWVRAADVWRRGSARCLGSVSQTCKRRECVCSVCERFHIWSSRGSVYCRYIEWTEQTFPQGGKESNLSTLLERAVTKFTEERKYHEDPRYVELWIKFVRFNN